MGRKSNLRKKFGGLKISDEDGGGDRNKNRTRNKGEESSTGKSAVGEDRISSLPDSVLANILSRLEIEEAVRTCVLAKTWMKKWTCISILRICDGFPFPKEKSFLNFVERVLSKILCIKDFTLVCFHNQDQSQVKELISAALKSDALESLCVSLVEANTSFSPSFFYSNSLIKLKLMPCTLRVSATAKICFNHLRSLILRGVKFQNKEASSSIGLLFIFPMLEAFKLELCTFLNVKSLKINAPLVTSFEMIQCKYEFQINGTNDQFAIGIIGGCSNLNFTYSGALEEKFKFSNPSAISSANLHIVVNPSCACQHFLRELGSRARLLLEEYSASLRTLELSEDAIMVLAHWIPSFALPEFKKLQHVDVPLAWFFSPYFHTSAVDLLNHAPVLEGLTINSVLILGETPMSRKCNDCMTENVGRRTLSFKLLSNLKFVKIAIYHGFEDEILLVNFLLFFAPVVQVLRIVCKGKAVAKELEKHFLITPSSDRLSLELLVVE